ncbi:hypothetical protein DFJ58DRAFT_760908, partial [Suillus subalutaceus]|uniref:uncharacterized protein n=1 Tax=Suillus subalutaceus TaxID=48586 RepID=UPI001B88491C
MSSDQARMNTTSVLRKSLIGEPLNTQFYLFSTRSKPDGNVTKLQPLFAYHEALTASSGYFGDLLSEEETPNDPNWFEFQDQHHEKFALRATISAEQMPRTPSIKDSNTQEMQHGTIPGRRVLVTDTAFKTWQVLLYYLYTDEITFAPLRSQASPTTKNSSLNEPPLCSPKSMYRLACKIKHDGLQIKALAAIRSSLTEHNVLQELSSSLTSRFPAILEMEVEILFQHITTPTVTKDFPILIRRIVGASSTDFPHGAEILTKLHEKMSSQLPRGRRKT